MKEKKIKNRWEDDTMILVSKKIRAKLKLEALKEGKTIKQFVSILVKMFNENKYLQDEKSKK